VNIDTVILSNEVGINESNVDIPASFSLSNNYPNPFNPSTSITYTIPERRSGHVSLKIYDLRGALVTTLVDQVSEPGYHSVLWDATDNAGHMVSSGVYIYRLKAGEFTKSNKMMLMR